MYETIIATPTKAIRIGSFQVCTWEGEIVPVAIDEKGFIRKARKKKACIRFKQFDRFLNNWKDQIIWCDEYELKNLILCLYELGQRPLFVNKGGDVHGIRSIQDFQDSRVHKTIFI